MAFAIALKLGMPRPYWAMTSVYVTSNQVVGATWSKATYRLLGALVGAAATIALVPTLVDTPELLILAVALWVGFCLYLSLIDGTPRGYAFMLSGYTVALLGFPVFQTPEQTFDIVVSRTQEILVGIVCAGVVSMLVLPRSVASAIAEQADVWLADVRRLTANVLTDGGSERERGDERMRLAVAASEIDQLFGHLGYEKGGYAKITRNLRLLRHQMLFALPLLATVEKHRLLALMTGVALTGVASGVVRMFGASWIVERIMASNWKTLAAVARGSQRDRAALAGLTQHRLALLAQSTAVLSADVAKGAASCRDLQVALNIMDARQAGLGLSRRARAAISVLAHARQSWMPLAARYEVTHAVASIRLQLELATALHGGTTEFVRSTQEVMA